MSAKQFFKGTAFKCIVVLLSILLVCGILLTIFNSLFYVSAEEKLARAISKIYGEEVTYEVNEVDGSVSVTSAKVLEVYDITSEKYENDYLLKVKGNGGYGGGSVTCWIRVDTTDGAATVKKLTIDSNVGQSYITKISGGAIGSLIAKQEKEDFTSFDTSGIKTGATFSMGAISNAANGALGYVSAKYLGTVSKFEGYRYANYIDDTTTVSVSGTKVTYNIVTKGLSPAGSFSIAISVDSTDSVPAISNYTILPGGNGSTTTEWADKMTAEAKDLNGKTLVQIEALISPLVSNGEYNQSAELNTHATRSSFLCYQAGAFATANYEKALQEYAQGGDAQ